MDLGDQFLFFVMVGLAAQLIDGAPAPEGQDAATTATVARYRAARGR